MAGGSDASALDTVKRLASALDADDFARVEACLHPDVDYRTDGATHHGPAAVVASYRAGSELARTLFDQVHFAHTIVATTDGPTIRVDFSDLLQVRGATFEHHSVQDITVDPSGKVVTIVDQPVAGQRERLDAFMGRHGLRRP